MLNNRKKSLSNHFLRLINGMFFIYLICTFLMLLIIDRKVFYYSDNDMTIPNLSLVIVIIPMILLLVFGIYFYRNLCNHFHLNNNQFKYILVLYFVALFILQLVISKCIYFKSGWDVNIIYESAEKIAFHGALGLGEYFNTYPNNLVMTYTVVLLLKVGNIVYHANPYAFVVAVCCFIVNISVLLSVLCVHKLVENKIITLVTVLMGTVLIGLSPWLVIPYTDTFGLLFSILCVYLYLYIKNPYWRYFSVFFSGLFGYFYKPTIIIVLIALVMMKSIKVLSLLKNKKLNYKAFFCIVLSICLAVGCAWLSKTAMYSLNQTELDENKQMTMTHYLMMGLNEEANGIYYRPDLIFSQSFPDVKSRQKGNLEVVKQRLKSYGIKGTIKLLVKKNLSNYNGGTFGWGKEGSFYWEVPKADSKLDHFFRSIYYSNDETNHYKYFVTVEQIVWLMILIFVMFCTFPFQKHSEAESWIALTLMGVSIFLLIFECRARYLFIFTPLFVVLAGLGLAKAENLFERIMKKDRHSAFCVR